ncbi:DUF3040 domain-containing protein [Arthrobacter sp. ISL-85]|uniref:DUF3040 domain-containing protein n=1 Tax=Arthrobacter sp. ISL-85 TaxID=2819115 RepID=UPI001BE76669|nr:DUF3040 domain-containing protein [Arthrobacter sp. ISL-85]MBT2566219.1 DUF3040 domain-containing protein [Arthrobacter sp. ISL-85]
MALSEEERRRLERIEQELAVADPDLALELQAGALGRPAARTVYAILTVIAGIAVVIAGFGTKLIVIGTIGFLLMLTGGYWFVSSRRRRRESGPKP